MEPLTDAWEQKFNELQNQHESLKQEKNKQIEILQEQINKLSASNSVTKNQHTAEFWVDLKNKCLNDPDHIKALVKNKTLTVFDENKDGKTLLILAAWRGSYEIVQFCINYGADINAKDAEGKTALDRAKQAGYYHIVQLLLFAQMNVNIENETKNTADTIHKQNGINYNILNELSLIGEQSKDLFTKILMELIINIIQKRLSFDDNLLSLCWIIASRENDPLTSDLWKTISSTCSDIIQNGSKRDWYWLKTCVIPSTIWFKDINIKKKEHNEMPHYLFSELLKLVDIESQNQLNKLEEDLNKLANENSNSWQKIIKWDLPDEYKHVRQDVIPNGIVSRYTYNQLSESSGATFNSPKFYDYNQYLSQLVLLAQIVDDGFQRSIQDMFNIDKVTNEGIIKFNNNMYGNNDDDDKKEDNDAGDGKIKYMRGPVKLIERARNKAQTDYANEAYPASACILDLNRCALVFNDVSTLLAALELFANKVKYYQSGNIIGIVRDKNGFIEYIKQTQYADIKLNVVISGKHNNLIGEVQFLLKTMKEFKDKAHNLYAIQRQQETIESSVSKILPMLLDEDKQLFIAGNRGNVKKLCALMVVNNKSIQDIMKIDKESGNTILHRICTLGHDKAFLFLKTIMTKEQFIKYALSKNITDIRAAEYSVKYGRISITKYLFDIEDIKQNYKQKNELFRLCYHLFVGNQNKDLTDYLLNLLNVTSQDVAEMVTNYRYKLGASEQFVRHRIPYDDDTIITRLIFQSTLPQLEHLMSVIGEKAFCHGVFRRDQWGDNGLETAIQRNRVKMMKFMLNIKDIKQKCIDDMNVLHSLISSLNSNYHESMTFCLVNKLSLTEAKINELQSYQYVDVSRILNIIQK